MKVFYKMCDVMLELLPFCALVWCLTIFGLSSSTGIKLRKIWIFWVWSSCRTSWNQKLHVCWKNYDVPTYAPLWSQVQKTCLLWSTCSSGDLFFIYIRPCQFNIVIFKSSNMAIHIYLMILCFWRKVSCSSRLHLFDWLNTNIGKY